MMNLPIEQFIPSGAGLLATIVTLIGMWFKFQNKVENLERKDNEQENKISDVIKWSHDHEKDAATAREQLSKDIFKLEGANMVVNEQFKQIMAMLQDIKERIEKLESR